MSFYNDISQTTMLEDLAKIETDINTMKAEVIQKLKEFILKMPEGMAVLAGDPDKTDATSVDDLWARIAKEGRTEPNIKDLFEYISKYTNERTENLEKELAKDLNDTVESALDSCTKTGNRIIEMQKKFIKNNEEFIKNLVDKKNKLEKETDALQDKIDELEPKLASLDPAEDEYKKTRSELDSTTRKLANKLGTLGILNGNGPGSIIQYGKQHNNFVRQLEENQKKLEQLSNENNFELEGSNEADRMQARAEGRSNNGSATTNYYANSNNTEMIQAGDLRKAAHEALRNGGMVAANFVTQAIDGEGYGDFHSMIPHLGIFDRRRLRNILNNRIEEQEIDIENLDDNLDYIEEIDDMLANYKDKTPKEIQEFEKRIEGLKYALLLNDAKRGPIRRAIGSVFSRKAERNNSIMEKLTEYGDWRSKRAEMEQQSYNRLARVMGYKDKLRVETIDRGNNARANNTSPESQFSARTRGAAKGNATDYSRTGSPGNDCETR